MKYVLDSCALLAYIRDEEGADEIEKILTDPDSTVLMHAVNVCEVYYDCLRTKGDVHADGIVASLVAGDVIIHEDMDEDFWKYAGRLKANGRISLADTFAVTLAARKNATLLTSDHHEFDPLVAQGKLTIRVRFVR